MKNAATNSDIFFAAVMDFLSWLFLSLPKVVLIIFNSDRIFHHERRYNALFMTKMVSRGIEVSAKYVVQPVTPSVRQLKENIISGCATHFILKVIVFVLVKLNIATLLHFVTQCTM